MWMVHSGGLGAALILLTGTVATAQEQPQVAPVQRPHEAEADSLAREIPGFGGFSLTREGDIVVYLKDEAQGARARSRVEAIVRGHRTSERGRRSERQVHVRPAQFTWQELSRWRDSLTDRALDIKGVNFVDLEEGSNRIVIGLERGTRDAVQRLLTQSNVPAQAVMLVNAGRVQSLALEPGTGTKSAVGETLRADHRPNIYGGIQVTSVDTYGQIGNCTLGFVTTLNGASVFITNSHCSATFWALDPTQNFFQADYQDADVVGPEYLDPNGVSCGWMSPNTCRYSDAVAVRITNPSLVGFLGRIARPLEVDVQDPARAIVVNQDAPTISIIADRNAPQRYEWVDKIGRTTGWTYAQVQHTCIDTKHPAGTNIRLRCQDLTDVRAAKGDSGAPVFLWGSSGVTLLGIVWGAMEYEGVMYTTMSALGNIWNDLAGSGPVYR